MASWLVKSEEYVAQCRDAAYPEVARNFLCWARILAATGEYAGAGWAAVEAAWICDDAEAGRAGKRCRERALELFRQARADGIPFVEDGGLEAFILADLLRRSGHFDEVETVCREGFGKGEDDFCDEVLHFQQALARRADGGCYTMADALNREEGQ